MAYPSIVNNPEYQAKAATLIASNHNQNSIADKLNISQVTVSRLSNLDSTRLLIEQARQAIINKVLPKAVENVQACVEHATSTEIQCSPITNKDGSCIDVETSRSKDMRYWGLRYSEKLMESIGVMGSQTPSVAIQNIFNSQTVLVSPVIDQLLGLVRKDELPALDVEYEDK